jgi:hypothetical protein
MNEKLKKIKQFAKDHAFEISYIAVGTVVTTVVHIQLAKYFANYEAQLEKGNWALGTIQRMYDELQDGPKAIRFHNHHFEMCDLSEVQ